jgi:hypothetical protein
MIVRFLEVYLQIEFAQLEAEERYSSNVKKQSSIKLDKDSYNREELREIIENLAGEAISMAQPLLAAGHHLSINDASSAAVKLIRSNELVYAFAVARIFKLKELDIISLLLAKRADRYGEKNNGLVLLKALERKDYLGFYIASTPLEAKDINQLYNQVLISL